MQQLHSLILCLSDLDQIVFEVLNLISIQSNPREVQVLRRMSKQTFTLTGVIIGSTFYTHTHTRASQSVFIGADAGGRL